MMQRIGLLMIALTISCSQGQGLHGVEARDELTGATMIAPASLEIAVEVPAAVQPRDLVLTASEGLTLNDRIQVGPPGGSEQAAALGGAQLAAGARVNGSVIDDGALFLGSSSRITRTLTITGAVTRQNDVQIGTETHVSSVPRSRVSFRVDLPAGSEPIVVNNDTSRSLSPGSYGGLDLRSRADLFLASGTYFFRSFNVEPQGRIHVDKTAGPIQIYVTGAGFQFKGSWVNTAGALGDLLVVYLGNSDAYVQGAFVGTLVAPSAEIALHRPSNNDPHRGAFFGRRVQVFSDSTVLHEPFPWEVVIEPILVGDPTFPPVGPGDVPARTPPPLFVDDRCQADFTARTDPAVDANHDGHPDIVQIAPRSAVAGCPVARFCRRVALPDGGEQFIPVPATPVLSAALPIPTGAISNGCSAEPAATLCPILGSTGQQAQGCAAEPAEASCKTVTMCPDPGTFDDPTDPGVHHTFFASSSGSLPNPFPPGIGDEIPGQLRQVLEVLYINPCEWDPVIDRFTFPVDINGVGKPGGEGCNSGTDCQSGTCEPRSIEGKCSQSNKTCNNNSDCGPPPDICNKLGVGDDGTCTEATSPAHIAEDEGSDSWNVKFTGGVSQAHAILKHAVFFPSTEFEVAVHGDAHLTGTAFRHEFNLFQLDITSEINECGYNFDWSSRSGDDDFQVVDGLIGEHLGIDVFVPGNVAAIRASSDPGASATCRGRLDALHLAEKQVNEALHDALIAATFYNLAGPHGEVIHSRDDAQAFINLYAGAARRYEDALAAYKPAQQAALDHLVAGRVLNFDPPRIDLSFPVSVGIGPFNPSIEVGIYGRVGLSNLRLENAANTHFTNTTQTPCEGTECFELSAEGSVAPKAAVGVFTFIGGGVDLVLAGGRVGIRGEVDLANFQLPLVARLAVQRTTLPPSSAVDVIPDLPKELVANILGVDINIDFIAALKQVVDLLNDNALEVPMRVAKFNVPLGIGGQLQSLEGPTLQAQFLSGRIKLWAKAWFLFFTATWEKDLASWNGFSHEWHLGTLLSADDVDKIETLQHKIALLVAPSMVVLPKLRLVDTPGTADPIATSAAINSKFDTQVIETLVPYDAHLESELGKPWIPATAPRGRCAVFVGH